MIKYNIFLHTVIYTVNIYIKTCMNKIKENSLNQNRKFFLKKNFQYKYSFL